MNAGQSACCWGRECNELQLTARKSLLQQGIDKGVKSKGTAYTLLAKSELGLKNKAGAIADMKLAAQQPETPEKPLAAWLKSNVQPGKCRRAWYPRNG